MSRGGRGGGGFGGRGGGTSAFSLIIHIFLKGYSGRGGGRGGFQQRDMGPPDTVLGTSPAILCVWSSSTNCPPISPLFRDGLFHARGRRRDALPVSHARQGPLLQRPHLPPEQVRHRPRRRNPRPHKRGLLLRQDGRGHGRELIQEG